MPASAHKVDRNSTKNIGADHMGGYNFTVQVEGIAAGYFKNVEGLSMELEVIEFQDGDDLLLRKRPGRTKYGDITLKKGYVVTPDLQKWWEETVAGSLTRKTITVQLKDNTGNIVQTWVAYECWPKAWKINGLDGKGNDVVTEEIVFVVEQLKFG
jgi:phage tail-like protein